jgi:hypothetical protein
MALNPGTRAILTVSAELREAQKKLAKHKPIPPLLSEREPGAPKNAIEQFYAEHGILLKDIRNG